jgi:hypothetical protein
MGRYWRRSACVVVVHRRPALALDAGDGVSGMPEWALSFWQWLHDTSPGQATFLGSVFGFLALLGGAWANASFKTAEAIQEAIDRLDLFLRGLR